MRKVVNPISKTKSKITVGGKIYNNLIEQGYVEINGALVKNLKVYDEDTEELVKDYEKQLISEEEDENEASSETDSSREFDFEDEEEFDEYIEKDYIDDDIEAKPKGRSNNTYTDYDEEDIDYTGDATYQPYYQPFNPSMTPTFSRPTQKTTYLETFPRVKCHTCSKNIGFKYKMYEEMKNEGYTPEEIFEELEIKRYCCMEALVHPQQMPTVYANPNAIYDLPTAKSSKPKLTKNKYLSGETKTTKLTKNKYLSGEPTKEQVTSTITRDYQRGVPVNRSYYDPTQNINTYKSLPTRQLAGSKYNVSYIGK